MSSIFIIYTRTRINTDEVTENTREQLRLMRFAHDLDGGKRATSAEM